MNISIRNGLLSGILSFAVFALPGVLALAPNIPVGILSLIVILLFMWNTSTSYKSKPNFRTHVREPFITFLFANITFFASRYFYAIINPIIVDDMIFTKDMIIMFPFGLILGFLMAGIITLVVRKSTT